MGGKRREGRNKGGKRGAIFFKLALIEKTEAEIAKKNSSG